MSFFKEKQEKIQEKRSMQHKRVADNAQQILDETDKKFEKFSEVNLKSKNVEEDVPQYDIEKNEIEPQKINLNSAMSSIQQFESDTEFDETNPTINFEEPDFLNKKDDDNKSFHRGTK